jgi:hypothetical protein
MRKMSCFWTDLPKLGRTVVAADGSWLLSFCPRRIFLPGSSSEQSEAIFPCHRAQVIRSLTLSASPNNLSPRIVSPSQLALAKIFPGWVLNEVRRELHFCPSRFSAVSPPFHEAAT